jgi:hypothetical protein
LGHGADVVSPPSQVVVQRPQARATAFMK